VEDLQAQAIVRAHKNGAKLDSIVIAEMDLIPLQYVSNGAVRAIVKAVGSTFLCLQFFVDIELAGGYSRMVTKQKRVSSGSQ
jgi:hypothetical protein